MKIKTLKWFKKHENLWQSESIPFIGFYYIKSDRDNEDRVIGFFLKIGESILDSELDSLDNAKTEAQKHFENIVGSYLDE